jgi:hypothetical protein
MRKWWKVPEVWTGEDAYVIGGGASIFGKDLTQLADRKCIGVNDAWRLGPEVCDYVFFGDATWYEVNRFDLKDDFPNPVVSSCESMLKYYPDVLTLGLRTNDLSDDPRYVAWNGNSGSAALNMALLLGAKRVFLLGFDMKPTGDRWHWHDCPREPNPRCFWRYTQHFTRIRLVAEQKFPDREIIVVGLDSAIEEFKKVPVDEVL